MVETPRVTVSFDASVYDADSIKKAAYTIAAQAAVDIRRAGSEWECELHFLRPTPPALMQEAVASFRIEVLDQDLRASIAEETREVRNAILAVAFSKTGLQGGG